ncbi:methyl-accepting chemotaxis protein [Thalassobacter stenotrophicus]|uniref:methyl-accepting chemotaxis protein n=1 Tax=Thalassobacter stenotrophicus TaxID=266809 RepID=UPI0022A9AD4E|nr:methyl-accepting chemotaxis protein [Thalassobacter stenotrophicus]UYP69011.1 methyl-accepting chemotaxis protein [Thalassobacter stenotrophicus]
MKLRTQVIALVAIPLLGIAILSAINVERSWSDFKIAKAAERSAQLTLPIAELIEELQVERAMSTGFVGTRGVDFATELPPQKQRVDTAIQEMSTITNELSTRISEQQELYQTRLLRLKEIRSRIFKQDINVDELTEYYSSVIAAAMEMNNAIIANFETLEMAKGGAGLILLSVAKEAAENERSIGASGFGSGVFGPNLYAQFLHYDAHQKEMLNQARHYSDVLGDDVSFLSSPEHADLETMRQVVYRSRGLILNGISGIDWFETSSNWIRQLRDYELVFQSALLQMATVRKQSAQQQLYIFASLASICFLITLVGGFRVVRTFTRGVHGIIHVMNEIAQKRFRVDMPKADKNSEIGQISLTLEQMREDLEAAENFALEGAFKRSAFELSEAPMFLVDTDFVITQLNDAASKMMEERADDFRSVKPDFDPKKLLGQNMDVFHAVPQKQRTRLSDPSNLPVKLRISVGEAFLGLQLDAVYDRSETHVGYVLEWKDLTELLTIEALINAIDIQQIRISAYLDGRIKAVNEPAQTLLGASENDLLGADLKTVLSGLEGEQDIWAQFSAGETLFQKFSLRHGSDSCIVQGSISSVPDHKGQMSGILFLGVDTTQTHHEMMKAETIRAQTEKDQAHVVNSLSDSLKRLANGDLNAAIKSLFSPEYEQLRSDFNNAIGNLAGVVTDVIEHAGEINSECRSISTSISDLSKRTEHQAATLEETAAAVEQLTSSVESAASGAQNAARIASDARENAEDSGQIVRDAVAAMTEIEKSSHDISRIISVIDDISFQTNLLALNAGVEAARAGEKGLGFAVVASEVRSLAHRSLEAANEIKELIEASSANVQHGVQLVGETGNVLGIIVKSVTDISALVNNIATSASEQSVGLSEINTAMSELETSTQHNAAMSEETTAATLSLTAEAHALVAITKQFQIEKSPQSIALKNCSLTSSEIMGAKRLSSSVSSQREALEQIHETNSCNIDDWREF